MRGPLARRDDTWSELGATAQLEAVPLADASEAPAEQEWWAEPHLVQFRRGLISAGADRDDRAVVAFREAINLRPDFAIGWLNLGHAFMRLRQWPEAADAYRALLKLPPDKVEAEMVEEAVSGAWKALGIENAKALAGVAH